MKKLLAIDASADSCSVALNIDGVITHQNSVEPRTHAQRLLPMIDALLSEAALSAAQLDALVLVVGPGSFTGIRIAMSVAQGLAYSANLPVYCVHSLETMAFAYSDSSATESDAQLKSEPQSEPKPEPLSIPMLDARMGELYWAAYSSTVPGGVPSECLAPRVSSPEEFKRQISQLVQSAPFSQVESFTLIGSGVTVLESHGTEFASMLTRVDAALLPDAMSALKLAQAKNVSESDVKSAFELEPLYLRNEVAWQKRTRIRKAP